MGAPVLADSTAKPPLRWWDAVSIIVGIIIGATIYRSPSAIFGNVSDQVFAVGSWQATIPAMWVVLGIWVIVGALSFLGALCYAELATAYPTSGGDFTYQTKAYGHGPGFMFAWAEMAIIRTGASIGAMAYVFGDYAKKLYPLQPHLDGTRFAFIGNNTELTYALVAILVMTFINALGLQPGRWVQLVLAAAKVLGLAAIIVVGLLAFAWPVKAADIITVPPPDPTFRPDLALAMVFVFYAYGGWHEAAYVAAEMKDRRRDMIRALTLGVILVTVIYLLVNVAYIVALGADRIKHSPIVAADVMRLPFQNPRAQAASEKAISVLIMISALGAINALLFSGIRLYSTFGKQERLFGWLSNSGTRLRVPYGALLIQPFFTISLLLLFATGGHWKPWLAGKLARIGVDVPPSFVMAPAFGFDSLVAYTAPVFWFFFLMTGYSVIALRGRDPDRERPFRVPLFPIIPLLFCAGSLFMLYRSTLFALLQGPAEMLVVLGFLLLGVPLYALSGPPRRDADRV